MRGINQTFILYFLSAISVICLVGCASFTPYRSAYLGTNHEINKNYELDVKKTTYVGESMIRVKDYYLSKFSAKTISPNVDLTITHRALLGTDNFTFYALEQYEIVGETVKDGMSFYLIDIINHPLNCLLLISQNGEVDGSSLLRNSDFGRYQSNLFKYETTPSDAKFITKDFAKTDTTQGYENYELIYTGKDKESFHITYREYSPEDLARTAFFQDLTYPSDAKVIRFKVYKILVDDATSESITFTVEEDGIIK